MPRCYICKQDKPQDEFYPDKSRKSGVMSRCKACDRIKANKPYAQRNVARHRAQVALWRQRHPERKKAQRERYRARKQGATGSFTGRQWWGLCAYYDWRCLRCGQRRPLTPDHIVPLALGGSNDIDNIQPLCGPCNYSKGATIADYRPNPSPPVEQLPLWEEAA